MTLKDYLSQIQRQEEAIQEKEFLIQTLRESLTSIGISYDKERVQSSSDGDKFGKAFSRIDEEETKLEDMKQMLIDTKLKVIDFIQGMDEPLHRSILMMRYVEWKKYNTLKQVADALGYSYDYIREIHGDILKSTQVSP